MTDNGEAIKQQTKIKFKNETYHCVCNQAAQEI